MTNEPDFEITSSGQISKMLRFIPLFLLLVCSARSFAQQIRISDGMGHDRWLYLPVQQPAAMTTDSLIILITHNKGLLLNNYYLDPAYYLPCIDKLHNLSKLHLYNSNGDRVLIIPEGSCITPVFLNTFDSNLRRYPTDPEDNIAAVKKMLIPFSAVHIDKSYPTAVLYWNISIGLPAEDNVFNQEQKLLELFDHKINILKVNTDVNANWPDAVQEQLLSLMQKINSRVSAGQ